MRALRTDEDGSNLLPSKRYGVTRLDFAQKFPSLYWKRSLWGDLVVAEDLGDAQLRFYWDVYGSVDGGGVDSELRSWGVIPRIVRRIVDNYVAVRGGGSSQEQDTTAEFNQLSGPGTSDAGEAGSRSGSARNADLSVSARALARGARRAAPEGAEFIDEDEKDVEVEVVETELHETRVGEEASGGRGSASGSVGSRAADSGSPNSHVSRNGTGTHGSQHGSQHASESGAAEETFHPAVEQEAVEPQVAGTGGEHTGEQNAGGGAVDPASADSFPPKTPGSLKMLLYPERQRGLERRRRRRGLELQETRVGEGAGGGLERRRGSERRAAEETSLGAAVEQKAVETGPLGQEQTGGQNAGGGAADPFGAGNAKNVDNPGTPTAPSPLKMLFYPEQTDEIQQSIHFTAPNERRGAHVVGGIHPTVGEEDPRPEPDHRHRFANQLIDHRHPQTGFTGPGAPARQQNISELDLEIFTQRFLELLKTEPEISAAFYDGSPSYAVTK